MTAINLLLGLLMIVMTWLGALGGYFLKAASSHDLQTEKTKMVTKLVLGVGFYGLGAILNIVALQYLPYTTVFPLTAVTYIWTMILSYFILKEKISLRKIAGVLLILTGAVVLVS
ncbi:EamA family transporter [Planococcus liqunii]|uniref:EamA family transporter n=1 Tax=Planococcus liqunii TaxID=3058394 RepID=A0ABT8MNT4_9BACL|nr:MULTISPECIES: EamA family transporter [unclassified Planococcus (in: firmicutes)]MDN7226451.1 EamA family transporter [Planococcus sp. N064]WKA50233.1 EamA family transporter [Planococcus sp. N056]